MNKIREFLSENFQVFEVNVSIYFDRRVFVMKRVCSEKKRICTPFRVDPFSDGRGKPFDRVNVSILLNA